MAANESELTKNSLLWKNTALKIKINNEGEVRKV